MNDVLLRVAADIELTSWPYARLQELQDRWWSVVQRQRPCLFPLYTLPPLLDGEMGGISAHLHLLLFGGELACELLQTRPAQLADAAAVQQQLCIDAALLGQLVVPDGPLAGLDSEFEARVQLLNAELHLLRSATEPAALTLSKEHFAACRDTLAITGPVRRPHCVTMCVP